jgi:predicted phosphoribosyltransferase
MDRFVDRADAGRRLGMRLAADPTGKGATDGSPVVAADPRGKGAGPGADAAAGARPGAPTPGAGARPRAPTPGAAAPDPVVLGLPRGGVPVAAEVAQVLGAPLDVLVVRKVGVPWQPEVAMGAVGEEGATVRNPEVVRAARVDEEAVRAGERRERAEVERRALLFRGGRPPVPLTGRTALIVDDGIATGATVRAACAIARARGAARVVVAVPVAAPDALAALRAGPEPEADAVVSLAAPDDFMAVGMHYLDFRQTSDEEVIRILAAETGG